MIKNDVPVNNHLKTDDSAMKLLPFVIIGVVCFCVYYLLNINTVPYADDLYLKFEFQGWFNDTITSPRVTNVSQIFKGMVLYYKTFRGRVIAAGLCQVFAVYGKQYFNISNSLIFVGITWLVYFHSNYGKKANWMLYLIICIVFWLFTPALVTTSLWMASSLCEFWPIFFVLLFLVPYRVLVSEKRKVGHPVLTTFFIIPIGFLAGAFNEQSFGLSIGFASLAVMLMLIRQKIVPIWSIIGLISTICGTLFVVLSPGNTIDFNMNPFRLYLHNFPGNVLGAFFMSFQVSVVLLLFIEIVFAWLIFDVRKGSVPRDKGKKNEHKSLINSSVFDHDLFIPGLFLITVVGIIVAIITLPYCFEYTLSSTVLLVFETVLFVCFTIFCLLIYLGFRKENQEKRSKHKDRKRVKRQISPKVIIENLDGFLLPVIFLITTLSSIVIATALPYVIPRFYFTIFVSVALVLFSLSSEIPDRIRNRDGKLKKMLSNKYLRIAIPVLISLVFIFDFGCQLRIYRREFVVYKDFVQAIEERIASGERNIILPDRANIEPQFYNGGRLPSFMYGWTMGYDDSIFTHKWFAYYLGAETLTINDKPNKDKDHLGS